MEGYTEIDKDGVYTLVKGDERLVMPKGATMDEINQARLALYGPDLSLPEPFPTHRLRLFLIATNRKEQVLTYLNNIADPTMRKMALEEFEYAPNFVPDSALARQMQTALGLSDEEYAQAVRTAYEYSIDDYGAQKTPLMARVSQFLLS
jgi:hypothetical protein